MGPILKDFRNSKVITLPSFPESKVEIFDALLVSQVAKFRAKKLEDAPEEMAIEIGFDVLPDLIKSWNFTNEDGSAIEITHANLNFLKEDDLVFLYSEITKFIKEGKKKDEVTPPSVSG